MNNQLVGVPIRFDSSDVSSLINQPTDEATRLEGNILPPDDDEVIEDEGAEIDDDEDNEDDTLYGDEDAPLEDDYGSGDVRDDDYVEDEEELDHIVEAGDEAEDNLRDAADEHVHVEDEDEDDYEDEELDDDLDVEL
jgi:hypothetical protein